MRCKTTINRSICSCDISRNRRRVVSAAGKEDYVEELRQAISLAMEKFKEEYGEDAKLEDGDEFVTVFNNCTLIISLENRELSTKFIGGNPCYVDMALSIYEGS